MTNRLPSRADLFLIAESLRQEQYGRISILGSYALGQILINPDQALPVALPLAIHALFREGEGKFKQRLRILTPSGKEMFSINLPDVEKKPEESLAFGVNFAVMSLPEIGPYKVEIILDDKPFEFEFRLDRATSALK